MENEIVAIYSGDVYHDVNGVTYKHFVSESYETGVDVRLITLPAKLFSIRLKNGDICEIRLKRVSKAG